nr:integrase, catalytic region, zinc finger, CCHC-type, peptidase aspartic, catalytic [Tanacetum cinerariifolium]
METKEISERYITPCFVDGLHAYVGEINLEYEKNMISNEFAVKLCLDYEEKDGEKVEISQEELENDIYERILILKEPRPIIETLKYSHQHKKLLDSVLLDKLKRDGEVEVKEKATTEEEAATEEGIRSYKAIKERNDPGVFVLPIRLEAKFDLLALADSGSNINVMPYRIYEKLGRDQTSGTYDDESGSSSRSQRTRVTESVEEAMLGRVHHEFLMWRTYNRTLKSRYNTKLARILPKQVYSPCIVDWTVLNTLGCGDMIEVMLDIKFYAIYEFKEKVTDEELTSKKLIKFRLGGRAHSLTILEFSRRLGLYTNDEIEDDGFETYFHGGLRNDDHFNANEYWLSISIEDELILSRSLAKTIWNPVLVLQKMITYGLCQRTIVDEEEGSWYSKGEYDLLVDDNVDSEPSYDAKDISEETLEDAEENRLKMRNKMVQLNYGKLNALYETFVPQQEPSVEQTYFSFPSKNSNSVKIPKSKDTKLKDRVLKNTNDKRPSAHVQKMSSSVSIDSNKRETMNSTICQPNISVLNTKVVNAVNDGSNLVCVSCGKDVFFLPHKKCVVRMLCLEILSGCLKHMTGNLQLLRNFIEKFMGTVRFGNDHFATITRYGDYVQGNLTICHVYYVEGLGHNLFLVG